MTTGSFFISKANFQVIRILPLAKVLFRHRNTKHNKIKQNITRYSKIQRINSMVEST